MRAYKILTHDLCSPIQGGEPIFDGTLPFQLPHVEVDSSEEECAAGWNACLEPHDALRIGGLWPDGRPSRLFEVEADDAEVIRRGDKLRAPTWLILSEVIDVQPHVRKLSDVFGEHAEVMCAEQMAWRHALSRPGYNPDLVRENLQAALRHRELEWRLKHYSNVRDICGAWDAWDARYAWDARNARAAWDVFWDARYAWNAWDARAAWDARDAWNAWDARDAWNAWDARAARDACDALLVHFMAISGKIKYPPDLLTKGIRDAYIYGLEIAFPTGESELGWAMVDHPA